MKLKLVVLAISSVGLLIYFGYAQIDSYYFVLPFIGLAFVVVFWPESKKKKKHEYHDSCGDGPTDIPFSRLFKSKSSDKDSGDDGIDGWGD